jgi:hypothetical protein
MTHRWKALDDSYNFAIDFIPFAERGVIVPQSGGSLNLASFETPLWESWEKKPFGCGPRGET